MPSPFGAVEAAGPDTPNDVTDEEFEHIGLAPTSPRTAVCSLAQRDQPKVKSCGSCLHAQPLRTTLSHVTDVVGGRCDDRR